MSYKVTLIPGDGSGPEVIAAAKRVVEATGVAIEWEQAEAGAAMIEKYGTPCLMKPSNPSAETALR